MKFKRPRRRLFFSKSNWRKAEARKMAQGEARRSIEERLARARRRIKAGENWHRVSVKMALTAQTCYGIYLREMSGKSAAASK